MKNGNQITRMRHHIYIHIHTYYIYTSPIHTSCLSHKTAKFWYKVLKWFYFTCFYSCRPYRAYYLYLSKNFFCASLQPEQLPHSSRYMSGLSRHRSRPNFKTVSSAKNVSVGQVSFRKFRLFPAYNNFINATCDPFTWPSPVRMVQASTNHNFGPHLGRHLILLKIKQLYIYN
jgi:hypothetical protein